jgi:hypothetical protein
VWDMYGWKCGMYCCINFWMHRDKWCRFDLCLSSALFMTLKFELSWCLFRMKLTECLHWLPECVDLCVIMVVFCVMCLGYLKSKLTVWVGPTGTKPSPELQKKPLIR